MLVEVVGGDLRSRADIAAAAAARSGLGLYAMSAEDIPTDAAERDRLARLWQREAILLPAALLVEAGELDRDQHAATDAFLAGRRRSRSSCRAAIRGSRTGRTASGWPCRAWTTRSNSACGRARSRASPTSRRANCGRWSRSSSCRRMSYGPPPPPYAVICPARTSWTPPGSPGGPG